MNKIANFIIYEAQRRKKNSYSVPAITVDENARWAELNKMINNLALCSKTVTKPNEETTMYGSTIDAIISKAKEAFNEMIVP